MLNYVRKRRWLKEPEAKYFFRRIVEGIQYIHSKNIVHWDIKLDNILLNNQGDIKIGDFGVSWLARWDELLKEQCGTPAYIAPEILVDDGYFGPPVDMWSAGVVLFSMLYGTVPFKGQDMTALHWSIIKGEYELKEDVSQEARDLVRGLLNINPKDRLTPE